MCCLMEAELKELDRQIRNLKEGKYCMWRCAGINIVVSKRGIVMACPETPREFRELPQEKQDEIDSALEARQVLFSQATIGGLLKAMFEGED